MFSKLGWPLITSYGLPIYTVIGLCIICSLLLVLGIVLMILGNRISKLNLGDSTPNLEDYSSHAFSTEYIDDSTSSFLTR